MDFYRSIFYYYRGPSKEKGVIDRQLENNTTKALVNVLDNCGPDLRSAFLRWLGINTFSKEVYFELQRETIGEHRIRRSKRKLLLGIVGGKSAEDASERAHAGDGHERDLKGSTRPDAWIYGDDFVVLVESKLAPNVEEKQWALHKRLLGPGADEVKKTWQGVHQFFKNASGLSAVEAFLVQQFVKYLEVTAMAATSEITDELFDFLLNPEDIVGRRWVGKTMLALGETVASAFQPPLTVSLGNIGKDPSGWYTSWVGLSRGSRAAAEAHLSIQVFPYELQVYADVETATIQRLLTKLEPPPERLKELLGQLEGFYITVVDRKPLYPHKFEYVSVMEFRTGAYIAEKNSFHHLCHLLQSLRYKGTYPKFAVRRSFSRHEVIDLKGRLGQTLVETARELEPLVEFINE